MQGCKQCRKICVFNVNLDAGYELLHFTYFPLSIHLNIVGIEFQCLEAL